MDEIPDSWPPDETGNERAGTAPMFPLPGVFLFPGQLLPLRIFEPRYREMVQDCLDGPGRIVLATVLEKDRPQLPGNPPVLLHAGLGEIARHEKQDDGCYVIWLCGLTRARIEEIDSEHGYRVVRYEPMPERLADAQDTEELQPLLIEAISDCAQTDFEAGEQLPLSALADVLAQCLTLPEAVMVDVHAEIDPAERARKVLAAYQRFPRRGH